MGIKDNLVNFKFTSEIVEIEGEEYIIKEMSSGQAVAYETSLYRMVGTQPVLNMQNAKSTLISICLYDKDGVKIFEDKDIELINNMPAKLVNKLFDACSKINGIGEIKN
jgi:hypothetical protein